MISTETLGLRTHDGARIIRHDQLLGHVEIHEITFAYEGRHKRIPEVIEAIIERNSTGRKASTALSDSLLEYE